MSALGGLSIVSVYPIGTVLRTVEVAALEALAELCRSRRLGWLVLSLGGGEPGARTSSRRAAWCLAISTAIA